MKKQAMRVEVKRKPMTENNDEPNIIVPRPGASKSLVSECQCTYTRVDTDVYAKEQEKTRNQKRKENVRVCVCVCVLADDGETK